MTRDKSQHPGTDPEWHKSRRLMAPTRRVGIDDDDTESRQMPVCWLQQSCVISVLGHGPSERFFAVSRMSGRASSGLSF